MRRMPKKADRQDRNINNGRRKGEKSWSCEASEMAASLFVPGELALNKFAAQHHRAAKSSSRGSKLQPETNMPFGKQLPLIPYAFMGK